MKIDNPENNATLLKRADWNGLRNLLVHTPWHLVSLEEEVNNCWLQWKDLFQAAVDDCIPKVNVKKNKTMHAPWISKEFILLCRKKKTSYKKAKKSGKDRD
jgi:hypothetical protein